MRRRVMRRSPLSTPSHMPITGSRSSCNSTANHSSGPDRTIGQSHCMHAIAPVRTPDALVAAIKLFRAYAASLNVDLSYQDFEAEMEAMPGKYAPPAGAATSAAKMAASFRSIGWRGQAWLVVG